MIRIITNVFNMKKNCGERAQTRKEHRVFSYRFIYRLQREFKIKFIILMMLID